MILAIQRVLLSRIFSGDQWNLGYWNWRLLPKAFKMISTNILLGYPLFWKNRFVSIDFGQNLKTW